MFISRTVKLIAKLIKEDTSDWGVNKMSGPVFYLCPRYGITIRKYCMVVTITDSHRSPYFNMVKRDEDKTVNLVIPPKSRIFRRQDAPVVYDMTTVCYVANPQFVMDHSSTFEGRVGAVHVPLERAVDIDTLLDFQLAECLMKIREQSNNE